MTWQEDQQFFPNGEQVRNGYRRARFRDAPFWVDQYQYDQGRRLSIQKFPGDQYTSVQDLGLDGTSISVRAFLVGENYHTELRALESALLRGGEGTLFLPWRGEITVTIVGRIQVAESKDARGFASVGFECLETAPPPIISSPDPRNRVRNASANARTVTSDNFVTGYTQEGVPETRKAKLRAALDSASEKLLDVQGTVSAKIGVLGRSTNQISRLFGRLNGVINLPLELSDAIVDAVVTTFSSVRSSSFLAQQVLTTWGAGGPARILAETTFNFSSDFTAEKPTVDQNNTAGVQEQQNLDLLYRMFALQVLYEFTDLLTVVGFESYNQATGILADFIAAVDPFMLDASDKEYEALANLVESVGAYLTTVAQGLPQLATFTPAATLPSLVIAHMLYGNARLEGDVVLRNRIQHPGFVLQGDELEVIDA